MCLAGVFGEALPPPRAHKEKALAVLGDAEVDGVEDPVVLLDLVALRLELHDDLGKKLLVLANSQAAYIFEDEILWPQLGNDPDEVVHKAIARIVQSAFSDHAEPLAWGAPENHVNVGFPDLGMRANIVAVDVGYAAADCRAVREIVFMRRGVDRIVLNRGGKVETGLLKSCLLYTSRCV